MSRLRSVKNVQLVSIKFGSQLIHHKIVWMISLSNADQLLLNKDDIQLFKRKI